MTETTFDTSDLPVGSAFGHYRIDAMVARGGMGVVYRATDLDLGRTVALKVIDPRHAQDADFRRRFRREANAAASLDHPHVLPVHSAGEHDGALYLDMRYVDGSDLRAMIRDAVRLAPPRAAHLTRQVAAALDAAHARGLIHRDVKPANVLVEPRSGDDHAFLTDFGLVKTIDDGETQLTRTGMWFGSLGYAAPEHVRGDVVDARADVYALATMLHQMLTGAPPAWYDATGRRRDVPPVRAVVPALAKKVDTEIRRAMSMDPDRRHASAGAFAAAVGDALGRAEARPAQTPPRIRASEEKTGFFTRAGRAVPAPAPVGVSRRWSVRRRTALIAILAMLAGTLPMALRLEEPGVGAAPFTRTAPRTAPRAFELGGPATDAAVRGGVMWAVDGEEGTAYRVDLGSGAKTSADVTAASDRVSSGRAGTWFVGPNQSLSSTDSGSLGASGSDVAVGDTQIWVLGADHQTVQVLTPSVSGSAAEGTVPRASAIATDGRRAWVLDGRGRVVALDGSGNGSGPGVETHLTAGDDLVVAGGAAWVLDRTAGSVARVDLVQSTSKVVARNLGGDVRAIGVSAGALWIVHADGRVGARPV